LEFYFQGEDHLDQAAAFEESADNPNPWIINHPFYGVIYCQVAELNRNNSALNVSEYTGTALETISDDNPKTAFDPLDSIQIQKINIDEETERDIIGKPVVAQDITTMQDQNRKRYDMSVKIITLPTEFESYYNAFNTASTFINTATASPLLAMRATIAALNLPAQFATDVKTRLNLLNDQWNLLRQTISNLLNVGSKTIYQIHGSTLLSSMCIASTSPLAGNYTNTKSVLEVIDVIVNAYNQYIEDLDTLSGPNGGNPVNYITNVQSLTQLSDLISLTVANLFVIALNARSERTLILEADTNLIMLTHRLYSLDPSDENMNELAENNGWGLYHNLIIRKNTKVVYYI